MQFKIVLSPFPFLEIDKSKVRPLIVLSVDQNTCIVAFVTSHIPVVILESDILLPIELSNITNLQKPSVIRLHKMGSIDKSLIQREVGYIPEELTLLIKSKLKNLFNL